MAPWQYLCCFSPVSAQAISSDQSQASQKFLFTFLFVRLCSLQNLRHHHKLLQFFSRVSDITPTSSHAASAASIACRHLPTPLDLLISKLKSAVALVVHVIEDCPCSHQDLRHISRTAEMESAIAPGIHEVNVRLFIHQDLHHISKALPSSTTKSAPATFIHEVEVRLVIHQDLHHFSRAILSRNLKSASTPPGHKVDIRPCSHQDHRHISRAS
mmetsp:Transcript_48352/g.95851  ORF Transcript_48352/g.95851 Transcript_48352/m.95851 type:complete len:214 (-) Transcript_48352:281-922(-)